MQSGDLTIDPLTRKATLADKELRLSDTEFDVLAVLVERKGQTVPRQWLLENVVGGDNLRMVDIHIKWLREKIETDLEGPRRIVTIRGVGYRFEG